MIEGTAHIIVQLAGAYLLVGALVAIPFVVSGVGRIDPVARDTV